MGDKSSSEGRRESRDEALVSDDVAKGYGFILPDERQHGDILLHVTCLRRDGFQTALEGARAVALARAGDRGLQAFKVLSMDTSTAVHPSEQPGQRTHVTVMPE